MPRRATFKEYRYDHQPISGQKFVKNNFIYVAYEETMLLHIC